jgi:hypothetical protein
MKARAILILAFCLAQNSVGHRAITERPRLWKDELLRLESIVRALPSDFEKTTFLRKYSGEVLDIGRVDDQTNTLYKSKNFESFNLEEFYSLSANDKLPATCGITTFFYIKLLQAFGFKAYQYSFGFKDKPYEQFIHSVTLVQIDFKGSKRLLIQDPYLNLTYLNQQGEPIDFFEFLLNIRRHEYGLIVMDASSADTFLLVPDPSLYYPYLNNSCKELLSKALRKADGSLRTKLPIKRNYETLMKSPCGNFEDGFTDALHKHGYQQPFLYAYALRASDIIGDPDHETLQREIDGVLR